MHIAVACRLGEAFKREGFELERGKDATCIIHNSERMPIRKAQQIISKAGYYPFVSPNRLFGALEFTVVPYPTPKRFDKYNVKPVTLTEAELWTLVDLAPTPPMKEDSSLPGGAPLDETLKDWLLSCNKISSSLVEFLDQVEFYGTALDMGCGRGINSLSLLEKSWQVTAIDRNLDNLLDLYGQISREDEQDYIREGKLKLIKEDITRHDFGSDEFDLVLGLDIIPLMDPSQLRQLMEKIHRALVPNGKFIGSLFFASSGPSDLQRNLEEFFRRTGVHLYPTTEVIPALLKHTGFHLEECTLKYPPTFLDLQPMCAEFTARKPSVEAPPSPFRTESLLQNP